MKNDTESQVIPCGVALIRRGHEFLIAQRHKNDTFGSYWEFPGGKKLEGEAFEACVAREAKEELGIEVDVQEKLMDLKKRYHNRIIWLNFYMCSHVSGEPQPLDCQNWRWVDVMKLKDFRFPPANEIVIDSLINKYAQR